MLKIILPVTAHRCGPNYKPCDINAFTDMPTGGNYDIEAIPPWQPFYIEDEEGKSLVERFAHLGAEIVKEA